MLNPMDATKSPTIKYNRLTLGANCSETTGQRLASVEASWNLGMLAIGGGVRVTGRQELGRDRVGMLYDERKISILVIYIIHNFVHSKRNTKAPARDLLWAIVPKAPQ